MKAALSLLYPPQCLSCGAGVAQGGAGAVHLCPDCWPDAEFITGACCDCCGAPLPDDGTGSDEALVCDDCLGAMRPWSRGRAAMVYGGTGRKLILALKHGDRLDLAPALAGWLARAARPLACEGMVVAPVPLHLRRLVRRKYNQSAQISARLARDLGLDHCADLLRRCRHTAPQDRRGAAERFANQQGALALHPRHAAMIQGRPVLLVDDVMASGATITAAATALLAAGSGPVSMAVVARAVKDH
ncbi:ComF family protein [Paracoccus aestuarii]|uniref:ComF family protein n=1 Tax=Paracoccus aestuarii TaxID=453842 RepID=A0A419A0Z1_9RHOB|nr:double zinc ribbon domain-containing protein [Paracoccus aestuarii]RJL06538.1 ComF family protein [Paracoccus aestuarii]WCQ98843.1 ComF family protein [Paracoccus aestuarii]